MTRTGKSPRLSQHLAEPFCEIHPSDAAKLGVRPADLVTIATPHGEVVVRALVSPRQAKGSVFAPMHWNDQFAAKARVDALVPAITDPVSGQPASKHVAARVARFEVARYGFAVLRNRPERLDADYWAIAPANGGWRVELAFTDGERDWNALAARLFGGAAETGRTLLYRRRSGAASLRRFRWRQAHWRPVPRGGPGGGFPQLGRRSAFRRFRRTPGTHGRRSPGDRAGAGWTKGPPSAPASASASIKSRPPSRAAASLSTR